ncbi:TPA: hypothetical protein ACGUPI_003179 [Vibrio vulnificus]
MSEVDLFGKKSKIWHSVLLVIVVAISYTYRKDIHYADIEPVVSILQNSSAMIFTIMGIWIAYVYPNAVLRITQPSKVNAVFPENDLKRIKMLVGIVVLSAIVILALIVGTTLKPFIVLSSLYAMFPEAFRTIGIFSLLLLVYLQLSCLYVVIASSVNFIIDLKTMHSKDELSKKLDG